MEEMNQLMIEHGYQWLEFCMPRIYLATTVTDFMRRRKECEKTPHHKYLTLVPFMLTKPRDPLIFVFNVDVKWKNKEELCLGGKLRDITSEMSFHIGPFFDSYREPHADGRYEFVGFGYNKEADKIYLRTMKVLGPPEKEKAGSLEGLLKLVTFSP